MSSENCFREGHDIATLLMRLRQAARNEDKPQVSELTSQVRDLITRTDCINENVKTKIGNEVQALGSFERMNDYEGVRQAVKLLTQDLGATGAPLKERIHAHLPSVVHRYEVKVNGKVIQTVKRSEGPQAFAAALVDNPNDKVEIVPI